MKESNARRKVIQKAARKAAKEGCAPASCVFAALPRSLRAAVHEAVASGIMGWKHPETSPLLALEATALERTVKKNFARREARFYWANIASALEAGDVLPAVDVPARVPERLVYAIYPQSTGDRSFSNGPVPITGLTEASAERLAVLWERESPLLGRRLRVRVRRALAASSFGQSVLAGRPTSTAEMYRRTPGGVIQFQAKDGFWYSPQDAEEMIHDTRPWHRTEIMAQFRRHADRSADAAEFFEALAGRVGPDGQGGMEIPAALAEELDAAERQAPLLTAWIAHRLSVELPPFAAPEFRPVTWAERVATGAGARLLGAHHEQAECIYLGPGFDRFTLVHELVHWVLTVTGARTRLELNDEAEEALANRLASEATKCRQPRP